MTVNTQKFTGKAIVLDYNALQNYDDTSIIAVCLTQRKIAIIKALLMPAYWKTRWDNLTLDQDELNQYIADIENQLSGNDCEALMIAYRDNPEDTCEVQYSIDGGLNWLTMFRKDNCPQGVSETLINNWYTTQTTVNNNYTTYAGDIINIAPDWEYLDPDQDNALCFAIQAWVDLICEIAITQIETNNQIERDNNNWIDDLAPAVSGLVVSLFVALIGTVVVIPAAVIAGVTYSLTLLFENFLDSLIGKSSDAYRDTDARQTISCYMWEQIVGATPQFASWSTALSDWASFGGNEKAIAETVHVANQEVKAYIEFLLLTEDLNSIAASLPQCPCPATWSHTWDFANYGADTWVIDPAATPTPEGTWVPGEGFLCEHITEDEKDKNLIRKLLFDEPIPRVTTMRITYDCLRGDFDVIWSSRVITLWGVGERDDNSGVIADGDGQTATLVATLGDATKATVMLRVATDDTPIGDYGYGLITHVTFEGVGTDPFEGRITS
jgi:hypothetical protein